MDWLEAFAAILGIISVWYARKENILVFPFGIANVAIYIYICFVARLYANAGINIIYLISNIFGWYMWSKTNEDNEKLHIGTNNGLQNIITWISVVAIYIITFSLLRWVNRGDQEYLNSYLPWMDSFNTAFFLIATILMAIKRLESWHFWIIGNIVSIPIFASRGLYFTSIQYTVFLVLAILGWKEWRAKIKGYDQKNEHK